MPTLANYFSTMKVLDEEIEEVRSELCQNPNFIPKALFDTIDIDQKGYITLNDFKIYLNNHFLPFEEQCLRRLIHNFDKDHDFSIDYEEFLGLVLTKSNSSIANNVTNKIIDENYRMDPSIDNIFIKLLKLELNLVKTLSKIADELKYSKDFTTYEAFLCITKNEKYITVENLGEFLNECNINIESYDPFNLMCRLDNDGDGKISYEEFINIFFPYKEDYLQSDININKEKINSFTIQNISSSNNNIINQQPSTIINNYYPYQNQNSNINYENENNENTKISKNSKYANYSEKIVELINNIRQDPSSYAEIIENSMINIVDDNNKNDSSKTKIIYKQKIKVALTRGEPAFHEAAKILRNTGPLPPFEFVSNMCITLPDTEEEIKDSTYLKRKVKELRDEGIAITVFFKDLVKIPEVSALLMIVDDSSKNAGKKRMALLNKDFRYIGVNSKFIGKTFIAYLTFS